MAAKESDKEITRRETLVSALFDGELQESESEELNALLQCGELSGGTGFSGGVSRSNAAIAEELRSYRVLRDAVTVWHAEESKAALLASQELDIWSGIEAEVLRLSARKRLSRKARDAYQQMISAITAFAFPRVAMAGCVAAGVAVFVASQLPDAANTVDPLGRFAALHRNPAVPSSSVAGATSAMASNTESVQTAPLVTVGGQLEQGVPSEAIMPVSVESSQNTEAEGSSALLANGAIALEFEDRDGESDLVLARFHDQAEHSTDSGVLRLSVPGPRLLAKRYLQNELRHPSVDIDWIQTDKALDIVPARAQGLPPVIWVAQRRDR